MLSLKDKLHISGLTVLGVSSVIGVLCFYINRKINNYVGNTFLGLLTSNNQTHDDQTRKRPKLNLKLDD
jgi:hypothetical protein